MHYLCGMTLAEITKELIADGLTEAQIAAFVGSTQSTVHRIKRGAVLRPRYPVGENLAALHRERCRNEVA